MEEGRPVRAAPLSWWTDESCQGAPHAVPGTLLLARGGGGGEHSSVLSHHGPRPAYQTAHSYAHSRARLRAHSGAHTGVRNLMPLLAVLVMLLGAFTGAPQTAGAMQASSVPAPTAARPPFSLGEALEYRVHVARGGDVGKGQMRVEGPVMEQGVLTWRLVFDMEAGKGMIRAVDRTTSWLDPARFAVVRFEKSERHPLSRSEEHVTMDLDAGTWNERGNVRSHRLGSALPLDELSFIYFLRTLPLGRDTSFSFNRHFDPSRNPTIVHVKGEELVQTPVGIFRTRIIEMHVRDPKRYRGIGIIRFNLDTADCHVPVRIRSSMPLLGATTLTLIGWISPPRYPGAMSCEQ